MKKAKVKYITGDIISEVIEGVIFDDISDITKVRELLTTSEQSVMKKFVKSGETPERMNHIVSGFQPVEKVIANYAISMSMIDKSNPIYKLGKASDEYVTTLTKLLIKGESVFMNPNGGLCPVEGSLEIVSLEEFEGFTSKPKFYIEKDSKVINLENDFELEDDAIDYMKKRFGKYSYIYDMKVLNEKQFINIFEKFKEQGGDTIYVYTTGMDFEQMYEYSQAAIKSGLKKFIFDFNCGLDKNINAFLEWLKERADVEVLNDNK